MADRGQRSLVGAAVAAAVLVGKQRPSTEPVPQATVAPPPAIETRPTPPPAAVTSPPEEKKPAEKKAAPKPEPKPNAQEEKWIAQFKAADSNGNGSLTEEEVGRHFPGLTRNFERVDTDRNHRISLKEFLQWRRQQQENQERRVEKKAR